MWSDEVVEEYKHHNYRISAFKGVKTVSDIVPIFKLFVKGFNNIVRYVIFKVCNSNMFNLNIDLVGAL